MEAIRLVPPPGLVAAAAALPRPAAAGDPAARLTAVLAAGAAGAYAWALDGPEAGRRVWGEQARLALTVLDARLERPGDDTDRFPLGSQVSAVAHSFRAASSNSTSNTPGVSAWNSSTAGVPGSMSTLRS